MIEQLRNRTRHAATIERVGIEIPDDDERGLVRETASSTLVIDQIRGLRSATEVVGPQSNFIVIATTVAILRPVEPGRCRMTRKQMQPRRRCLRFRSRRRGQPNDDIPMTLGGNRQDCERLGGVPLRRDQVVRHVAPQHVFERTRCVGVDGPAREHEHAVLSGESTEAEGIVAAFDPTIAIEVDTRRHPRIRGGDEVVRIIEWLAARL